MSGDRAAPMPQPGGRPSAPGRLHLVQDFVNTVDIEDATDVFDSMAAVGRWLRLRDLLGPGDWLRDPADLDHAVRLREALREVCAANHDLQTPPPASVAVVETAARDAVLTVTRDPNDGWGLRPQAAGLAGALGRLVAIMYDAMTEEQWWRLKVCDNDACRWAFWDSSPNRAGRWCVMAICGNRAKITAYRDRTRRGSPDD
jgi:predicted RNA-binding Zn ribbon-like protein